MSDVSTKITVNEKEYTVRKLNVNDLLHEVKQIVRGECRKEAMLVADELTGSERSKFLTNISKNLPRGVEMAQMVSDWFKDIDGINWALEKATGEKIDCTYADMDDYSEIIDFALPEARVEKSDEDIEVAENTENFTKATED